MHIEQESGEVLRDFLVADEVLGVVSCVQLGDEVPASLIDVLDGIWELVILLLGVLETDWAQML